MKIFIYREEGLENIGDFINGRLNRSILYKFNNMNQGFHHNEYPSTAPLQNFSLPLRNLYTLDPSIFQLFQQNSLLMQQNAFIRAQLQIVLSQKEALLQENARLRQKLQEGGQKERRKYSERRKWLQKKFVCQHEDCRGSYSSKIALNHHIRKRHQSKLQTHD